MRLTLCKHAIPLRIICGRRPHLAETWSLYKHSTFSTVPRKRLNKSESENDMILLGPLSLSRNEAVFHDFHDPFSEHPSHRARGQGLSWHWLKPCAQARCLEHALLHLQFINSFEHACNSFRSSRSYSTSSRRNSQRWH